jgi:transposase-like protein
MTDLTSPIYTDETAARKHLEAIRWPDGVSCPLCGGLDKIKALGGDSMGDGWYHCGDCRKKFTVRVGTVYERSHIPLHKWVLATHLMAASKKGVSAHQLHRMLGITYKSAWFMAHRIREAMKGNVSTSGPIGGEGKTVEADETYFGAREDGYVSKQRQGRPYKTAKRPKRSVVALVERGGEVRTFHVKHANKETVADILYRNVPRDSTLYTDESRLYTETGKEFAAHETVKHSADEYVRGVVHTNTVEGYFSIFKRGMKGVYQHCGEAHLHRYLAEFDFRYNKRAALKFDDDMRAIAAIKGAEGKRLTYRRID